MPAQSQQQQKLFGLALAVKRGEVSPSEVSDEVKDIVDRMSEKDIEDFAGTSHKGLPKKVEQQMREMVREIMRERVIFELNEENPCWKGYEQIGMKMKDGKEVPNCVPKNESVNEVASRTAMEIGGLTGLNKDAIQKFVDTHNMDIEKVYQYVKKSKLTDRLNFVTAIVGTPGNSVQKKMIKMFGESVNEEKYPIAVEKFNKELIKHPMVKKAAQHYKKTPAEIVKVLQQRLYSKGDKTGNTKEVWIDFKDTTSGITIKHKMKF